MKFKNIFFSLLGGMLIGACTPNEADVYLHSVKPADIKILELMPITKLYYLTVRQK